MSISRILKKVAEKSNGKMRIVKVPPEKRPTAESLEKLEREIGAQIDVNRAMEHRSYINASKKIVEAIISLYRKGIITIKNYTEKLMDSEVLQSMISSKCIRLTEKGYKKLTGEFASPHSYIRIPVYYRMFYYPIFNLRDILVYSVLRQYTKAGYECLLK